MCTLSANEFGASPGGKEYGLANVRLHHVQRNGHLFQVHSDKRTADIETGIGLDMFDGYGMLESLVAGCGKRASGLRLGDHIHDFCERNCRILDDDSAVQVFAALRRNINAKRLEYGRKSFENRLADLGHRMATDVITESRTCAAPNYDNLACSQVRFFNKFLGGVLRVATNLFDKSLIVYFVCDSGQDTIPTR